MTLKWRFVLLLIVAGIYYLALQLNRHWIGFVDPLTRSLAAGPQMLLKHILHYGGFCTAVVCSIGWYILKRMEWIDIPSFKIDISRVKIGVYCGLGIAGVSYALLSGPLLLSRVLFSGGVILNTQFRLRFTLL